MTRKRVLEKFDTEIKLPAVLNLQLWDNDSFSTDDFLGTASINLSHFKSLFPSAEKCAMRKEIREHENLFATNGSIRGWLPMYGKGEENGPVKQTVS